MYHKVEQSGEIEKSEDKTCSSKIKIGARIDIAGICKATFDYVKSRCTNENNAETGKPATAGYSGAATSRGKSTSGKNGLSVARGNNVMVRGGLGAILVIAEEKSDSYDIQDWRTVIVDGKDIKADTWYRLENGELIECNES